MWVTRCYDSLYTDEAILAKYGESKSYHLWPWILVRVVGESELRNGRESRE